jgi:hypothetical protein
VHVAQQRRAHRTEAHGENVGDDLDWKALALGVVVERDGAHAPDLDAEQVDRGTGTRPRTDWSNDIRTGSALPSGGASAERRSLKSGKTLFSGAGVARVPSGGVSNATPPARIDTSVCVLTLRPLAFSVRSIPLAFQKRLFVVTSFGYGASMKTFSVSSSRSASSV